MAGATKAAAGSNPRYAGGMIRLAPIALLLIAAPAAAAKPYRALGTEPFWSLSIERKRMTFDLMDHPKVRQPTPKPRKTRFGRIYWTRRISVAIITNQPCSDGMSDYVYRDDVTVTVDGKKFLGCGGPRHLRKGGSKP
jgi:heat shock protein HslJ